MSPIRLNYITIKIYFNLHSHWMTSKLNCWMAPILICLSSVSSSICISEVDRCLQADIQAVWATLPCRQRDSEKEGGKGWWWRRRGCRRGRKDVEKNNDVDEEDNENKTAGREAVCGRKKCVQGVQESNRMKVNRYKKRLWKTVITRVKG